MLACQEALHSIAHFIALLPLLLLGANAWNRTFSAGGDLYTK